MKNEKEAKKERWQGFRIIVVKIVIQCAQDLGARIILPRQPHLCPGNQRAIAPFSMDSVGTDVK